MSLTRKFLASKGIDADVIDEIIQAHVETVNSLKDKLDEAEKYKAKADKYDDAEEELTKLKEEVAKNSDKDYEALKKEYDDFKADVERKETKVATEKAVKAYLKEKNITDEGNLEIFMRGSRDEIEAAELTNDGKIKDTKPFDDLIAGTYAKFVESSQQKGADTPRPPHSTGGTKMTKEEIMKIKDHSERQKAIAENHELFGY